MRNGDRNCFTKFYLTNSIPTTTINLPLNDVFVVFDLAEKIINDIDGYS